MPATMSTSELLLVVAVWQSHAFGRGGFDAPFDWGQTQRATADARGQDVSSTVSETFSIAYIPASSPQLRKRTYEVPGR